MDFVEWEHLEKLLYRLSRLEGYKAKRGERKKSSPLISPATYKAGSTRANSNVVSWAGWAALDVDSYEEPFDTVVDRYRDHHFVCYSTASSRPEKPKFRLVFPLTHHVPAEKIRHFWYALNKQFNCIADEQAKDLSRMYYVPAQYPGAHNFIFTNSGNFLNPDSLMATHPYIERKTGSFMDRLPEKIQKEIMELQKERMTNRAITWTSYKDCPFVNRKLVSDYRSISRIDGSGRYLMIYRIMTSIACNAVKRKYPISSTEIAELVAELDRDTSRIYQDRPLKVEAERAIEYAYRNASS